MIELEKKIGYTFQNKELLQQALTHSSYANEHGRGQSYERLEFLGDSILGFCAARVLYTSHPDMPEGQMTRLRASMVCEDSLYQAAEKLGLSDYLRLGKNEECNHGRQRPSILADCVESLLAAIYLDGGWEPAERFVYQHVLKEALEGHMSARGDYKTLLQEMLQAGGGAAPAYEIIAEAGPDHDKVFTARVLCPDGRGFEGVGKTKKEAERVAAGAALRALREESDHGKK